MQRDSRSPPNGEGPRGWYSRGYLPHFDGGEVAQSITFRTAGSLPADLLRSWTEERRRSSTTEADVKLAERVEQHLDAALEARLLANPRVAKMMEDALLHFDGERYRMHAWAVMPNHVHALATPVPCHSLGQIVHSWKSYVANKANRMLSRTGRFWDGDFFDRYIRTSRHFDAALAYVEYNPVAAGLCNSKEAWPFSSARRRGGDADRSPT